MREIGAQCPFGTGVVNGGDPDRTRPAPTAGLEKLDGVAQFGHVAHPDRTGLRAEGLPPDILAGQRPGVRSHHLPAARGVADRQDYDGHVLLGGTVQGGTQPSHRPGRLQQQCDQGGAGVVEREVDVVGGTGDQFLAGGDRQPKAEPPVRAKQGGERRSRVGDQ